MKRFLGALFLVYMGFTSLALFLPALVLWAFTFWWDKRLQSLHLFTCFWASLYTWPMRAWPLTIEGKENIRKGQPYVIVSNHQSLLDILMYFRLFFHFKWVSKAEIFRIPLVGWNMRLNRYIGIQRGNRHSGSKMLIQCRQTLNSGSSIFMFPEGTRSRDGQLGTFKISAFKLAKENKVPILPMVITGTTHALPKKSFAFHGTHPIHIKILPEIPFETFQDQPIEELLKEVHALIARELSHAVTPNPVTHMRDQPVT